MRLGVRETIATGFGAMLESRKDTATTWGDVGWRSLSGGIVQQFLPGSDINYEQRAGKLWLNSTVSIALKWREDTFEEARQVVRKPGPKGDLVEVPKHPLLALLNKPLPWQDGSSFNAAVELSMTVDGNAYIYLLYSGAGAIAGLQYIPHMICEPMGGGAFGGPSAYRVRVQGSTVVVPVEDMIHLRDGCDPDNMLKGLSRLAALLRQVCTDNELNSFYSGLLHHSGLKFMLISPKNLPEGRSVAFSETQRKGLKRLFMERSKVESQIEPVIPSIPIDVHTPGFSPGEMGLDKIAGVPKRDICAAVGVDATVLGIETEGTTYSNKPDSRRDAYNNCKQFHRKIDRQLTSQLLERIVGYKPGEVVGRDYTKVAAIQQDVTDAYKRFTLAVGGPWLTRNEARAELGFPDLAGGDDLYPARTQAAVQAGLEGGQGEAPPKPGKGADPIKGVDPSKARKLIGAYWRSQNGHKQIAEASR